MSTIVIVEEPEKKRAELQNELALLEQKTQAVKEEMKKIEEKLTTKLAEKVTARRAAFEKIQAQKNEMEKQLQELENQESPSKPMLCPHCGSENITDAVFCEKCGKKMALKTSALIAP